MGQLGVSFSVGNARLPDGHAQMRSLRQLCDNAASGQVGIDSYRECPAHRILDTSEHKFRKLLMDCLVFENILRYFYHVVAVAHILMTRVSAQTMRTPYYMPMIRR